jgi:SAM-dependent methyltransferase
MAGDRLTDWPAMARFMGRAGYDRQAFTLNSAVEADFVAAEMGLRAGAVVADIGCGTGRHLGHWRRHGLRPVGIDLSAGFGPPVVGDALSLPLGDQSVDAAVSLFVVAGAVPLVPLLAEMARVARQVVVVAAFSLPFAQRHMGLAGAVVDEVVRVPDGAGRWAEFRHVHECYEPAEMPGTVYGVEPGDYTRRPPDDDHCELLAVWHPTR